MILAVNATPCVGGQGLNLQHLIVALRELVDLGVFCRKGASGAGVSPVRESPASALLGRCPVIRRRRDWRVLLSESHFDRHVARRLTPGQMFQGTNGACWQSLTVAKSLGYRTVLDSTTTHIDDLIAVQVRECAQFGVRPPMHGRLRVRTLGEYQRADVIRVASEYSRRAFLERGFAEARVMLARPPIEVEQFSEARFDDGKFRVICVGLLEPWKGFHYLVRAFTRVGLPDSELVLGGGPGARPISRYLGQATSRNPAIVVRPMDSDGCKQAYARSSVLVHPSLSDGFGYVVVEAMASGLPVIVTRNTGAAELVVDGKSGYVIPAGDEDAICDRLRHLAFRPGLVRDMGRAARETARSLTIDEFRKSCSAYLNALMS